jgi:uncharacterized protein YceH (UPF0502 family)
MTMMSDADLERRRFWFSTQRDMSGDYGLELVAEVERLRAQVADLAALLNQVADEVGDMYWEPDPTLMDARKRWADRP